jgi:hypothetical protein
MPAGRQRQKKAPEIFSGAFLIYHEKRLALAHKYGFSKIYIISRESDIIVWS